ncbi:uncharacterized protein ACA1_378760 [Acanthamoeba castellanii str. Neff]|uniref:Uncharacterized protein n=1 Tax=Acanthamoeba castellanii (strain ATCC 30010 / Neff) TaxID=1257118 RepID=L8GUD2_ACACF|nr:uncharacterized protein ACA1_378760 [Acanthamoeba castellanii str. Neff]ELR15716.1 hypothetical protein ACA1_378760 [Acanthamoeba castellanii str. Neff]
MGDNKKQRKQVSESGSSTPSKKGGNGSSGSGSGKKQKKSKASPATSSSTKSKCATKSSCWFSWVWSIICFFVPAVVFALLWWAFKPQIDTVMEGYVVPAIHTVVLPIFPKLTPASVSQ